MVMLATRSLFSLDSLDLDVLSGTETTEEAMDAEELGSPSSFILSLRCMASLQHNSKDVGLLAMRVSWIFTLLIPKINLGKSCVLFNLSCSSHKELRCQILAM